MSEFFIGQVMMTGFGFAPRFWAQCNGQLLPINQNQALFALLGTQYGGNGTTTFALPDLRGRVPVGYASSVNPSYQPQSVQIGEAGGQEQVTLLTSEIPAHGHATASTLQATSTRPSGGVPAGQPRRGVARYTDSGAPTPLGQATVVGGNQPHTNLQPFLAINFCIALSGIFPSRS